MENNEKSIREYMKEGYERGVRLAGGMEEPRIAISPEPLPDDVARMKQGYWIFGILFVLGMFIARLKVLEQIGTVLGAIGLIGFLFYFVFMLEYPRKAEERLDEIEFKLKAGVDNVALFNAVHPALVSKYGMQLERDEDGDMMIIYDNIVYDVSINEDNTFCICATKQGILPGSRKKRYRKKRIAMGIIAYEIQKAFSVNVNVSQVSEV